jgi:Ras family protein A
VILCGLKSDLRHKKTCIDLLKTQGLTPVTQAQGLAMATRMGARYMECSSKENIGVEEIFDQAVIVCCEQDEAEKETGAGGANGRGSGLSSERRRKRKGGCKFL